MFLVQRIYGTAWETPEQLQAYIKLKEEAAKRDHRRLGRELDLFSLQETAGGCVVGCGGRVWVCAFVCVCVCVRGCMCVCMCFCVCVRV